ncbi:MAG TPA: hypothetical protein VHL51_04930 [Gaiellales bacterium]|nr:hypothetical protein [Gaiellales bacterium]
MIWFPRIVGLLTAIYGVSAIVRPDVISRHGELASPEDARSGVHLLSVTVGIRDVVSGAAIMVAPAGGVLLGALGARVALDTGDAVAFGRLLPTPRARRKVAAIALGWAAVAALSMLGARG